MFIWITWKDDKVNRVMQTPKDVSPGAGFEKVPNDWRGNKGDRRNWFDETMHRIADTKLVQMGIRKDNRGVWNHKYKEGERKQIDKLDVEAGHDWTRKERLPNESFQDWDEEKGNFVVNSEKKEKAKKENEIGTLRSEINSRDWRWAKAQKLDVDVDEIYPGERDWYTKTVAKINELESALEGS